MASAIIPRIATASVTSRRVKARPPRRSTGTIDIEDQLLVLFCAVPRPFRSQRYSGDSANDGVVLVYELFRRRFLNQLHDPVPSIHLVLFSCVGPNRACLYLRHSIRQQLPDPILLLTQCACIQTILHGPAERENAEYEDRQAKKDLVERKAKSTLISPHNEQFPGAL